MVAEEQGDFTAAREWYLKSLAIKEQQDDLHGAAMTYGNLGILEARQGNFEDAGKWFARAITSFRQTRDQRSAEQDVRNFLRAYQKASPGEKQELKAIWLEAGLGHFPT